MKKHLEKLTMSLAALGLIFSLSTLDVIAQSAESEFNDTQTKELQQVEDKKYVCMVTNRLFSDEQILIDVEGKSYYGCCQMCVKRLNNNPDNRTAIDPVSGNEVNKAEAVIGADEENRVYYFESVSNLQTFKKTQANS